MIRLLQAVVCLCTPVTLMAQTQYSHGDPTPEEQYMLELINRARANPEEEGVRVMDTEDARVQSAYQFFNIDAAATKAAFKTYPSRPPLVFHPDLMTAARDHTSDMVQNNFQGHTGSDGSSLQQRYQRVGYQSMGLYGENVSAYSESVWFGHCGLIVDWGEQNQIELGHRRNLLNFDTQVYTEIGIGITKTNGGLQQGTVGPYVITQDFGIRNVKYITGVVYDDKNNNDFYDVGEGMAGVKVEASNGQYYAITSTSGGYAIPYGGTGQVTVTASGGGLPSLISIPIIVGSESFKLDFTPEVISVPVVTLVHPDNERTDLTSRLIRFEWEALAGADRYGLEVATDTSFSPESRVHSGSTFEIHWDLEMASCDTVYYWRVRHYSGNTIGRWSSPFWFRIADTKPNAPDVIQPIGATSVEQGATVTFSWNSVEASTAYILRVFDVDGQKQLDTVTTSTSVEYTLDRLMDAVGINQEFLWQVVSWGTCSAGPEGDLASAVITVTSVSEERIGAAGVVVNPHPATSLATIQFQADVSGTYRLRLIDAAGAEVVTRSMSLDAGSRSVEGLFSGVAT